MKRLVLIFWRIGKSDLRLAWFALRHPARPAWLIPALVMLGIYALAPFNFALPPLGAVDDLVLVPMVLHLLLKLLPQQLRKGKPSGLVPMRGKRL